MITTTVNSTGYSIYVDGAVVQSGAGNGGTPVFMTPDNAIILGTNTDYGYVGSDDDFTIFGSVLTPTQISQLYASGVGDPQGTLPTASPVQIAAGAALTWRANQTVASLADGGGSGGTVTNSAAGPATLTLAPPSGSTTFSGVIQDGAGQLA